MHRSDRLPPEGTITYEPRPGRAGRFWEEGFGTIDVEGCCQAIIHGQPGARDALMAWVVDPNTAPDPGEHDEPKELPLEEESEFGARVRTERERILTRIGATPAPPHAVRVIAEEVARLIVEHDDLAKGAETAEVRGEKPELTPEKGREWIRLVAKAIHSADPGRQFDFDGGADGWNVIDDHLRDCYERMAAAAINAWELGKLGDSPPPIDPPITHLSEAEAEAISDVLQVATRVGSSYETYGGVPLADAIPIAEKALERLAPPGASIETVVDDEQRPETD